jgi:release factor glutamine methyltransferase
VTVLEVIQRSAEFLARKGVETPRLQAELLLAHVLACPRLKLYLNFERALAAAELDSIRELVRRRGNREPLQYLASSTSFCGIELKVTPAVLIPRPETEVLAERAWTFLAERGTGPAKALDFGTGSGCLAIAVATHCPGVQVTAMDASAEALAVAAENAAQHGVAERVRFLHAETLAAVPGQPFHLVVANPPYIPSGQLAALEPEVRDHEPRLALDGGPDGLDVIRHLATHAAALMHPEGRVMLEFGDGQAAAAGALFEAEGWRVEEIVNDLAGRPRHLMAAPGARTG